MSNLNTSNYIVERIERIRTAKNISRYRLALTSGLTQSTISNLLNRQNTPSIHTLEKICAGLDMTLAQFFSYDDEYPNLSPEQKNLLDIWASLSEHKRELALAYLSGLMQSSR